MEQLPADKTEKIQGESSSSSETESIVPIILEKLKVGGSSNESEQDTDLEPALAAILENESEFDGSDLIAIPNDGREIPLEALIRAKKYSKITDDQRKDFIDAVEVNGEKIINAAKRFNINYSSAKSILNVYKNEGRSIKKLTRNRGSKGTEEDGLETQVIAEAKNPQNPSPNNIQNKIPTTTFDASTQTHSQEESQGDNYLLALRDRLIASKTEKRENPYSGSMSHDFARHTGSLGDYSQQQMANSGYEMTYNTQSDGARGFTPPESKGNLQSPYMQQSSSYLNQSNNSQQQYSSLSNNPQSQSYQQQQSYNPENRGIYSGQQQSSNQQQQQQNYTLQQDHKSQAQQYLVAQNNLDQQRLQSAAGFQNQLSNLGFSQPQANSEYSGMSYTGTGQSQYFSDSANESRNMMQMNQVQYLQPIMYLMPSNFPGMNNQNGFIPSSLQGLSNLVSLPNSYMLYGGGNQGGQGQGQNQGQGQGQGQNQSSNLSQNQGQSQGQGQGQSQYQNQGQGQNQYQNQGQYYGPR